MAERNVSVRLYARVDPYIKAMDQARAATAKLEKESSMNMSRLGSSMQNVGKKMTVGVTLPIVGIGAAAVKMSNDFDSAFGQMVGLAGVAAEDVDGLKESVLDLAGETARAPQELAEALYFAASAGLDTKQSMEAVTIAAKASAAGLGTTQDVVGLVASAVASYGSENIDAARATDILTSAIREGRAEPAELAGALGRVLPVAASLGVEFEEVGGTVAYLSNIFGDTDRTVTAVNDTFAKLAAPTDSARTALEAAGTSADELKRTIADDGLLAGLELLRTHGFQGNAAAIRELMPDMQGATALTALLDDASGSLSTTLGAVADSTGSLDTAFGAIDEDAQGMKQAMVDLQVAAIQIGEVVGPIVADLAGVVGGLAGAFADLDPVLQKAIIGIAGTAAAVGPLLIVTGSLIKNYTLLKTAIAGSNLTMASGAAKMGLLAKAAAVGVVAYASLGTAIEGVRGNTQFVYKDLQGLENVLLPMQQLGKLSYMLAGGSESAATQWAKFEEEAAGAFASMTSGVYTMERLRERLDESTLSIDARNLITIAFKKSLDDQAEAEANLAEATAETTEAVDESTEAMTNASSAAEIIQAEIDKAASNVRRFGTDGVENMGSVEEAADATAAEIQTLADEFAGLLDQMSDRGRYLDAQDGFDAVKRAAEESYTAAAEGAEDAEAKSRAHERAVMDLTQDVIGYADEIGNIPEETVSDIIALIDQDKLAEAEAALAHLERVRNARINVTTYYNTGNSSSPTVTPNGGARALGGPTYQGMFHEVTENGSELLTENGRTYLMAASNGFVTPLPAAAPSSSAWGSDGPVELGDTTIKKLTHGLMVAAGVVGTMSEAQLVSQYRGGLR